MTPVDLLSWPDVRDAEEAAARARLAWAEARRRWKIAPHGERANRLAAMGVAARVSIEADLALQAALRQAEAR